MNGSALEMARHVQIVTNPTAGSYDARKIAALVSAFASEGASATISYVGAGEQLVIEDGADVLCAAGGDGTLRHLVQSAIISGQAIPIAPYPMGTINLHHRETGYPKDAAAFAKAVLAQSGKAAHFPVSINDTLFLGCASMGPDAHAVASVSSALKRRIGRLAYAAALLGHLLRWPRPQLTLIADGKRHPCEAVYIAKGRFFAGPWSFAPLAARAHQKLHVVALKNASRWHFFRFVRNTMRGRPLDARDNLIVLTCTALRIEGDRDWPVQADGDDAARLPVDIAVRAETFAIL